MKLGAITGTVGTFGDDCNASFNLFRGDPANQPALLAWDAIHNHRVNVAHLMPGNLSLADFEQFYKESKAVLVALATSLHLTAPEIAALTWP